MASELSGNFSLHGLKDKLVKSGVEEEKLLAALKKIVKDNDLESLDDIDTSVNLTVKKSIFTTFAKPEEKGTTDVLAPYFNTKLNLAQLPKVYNDDEYDVADYDDYYFSNSKKDDGNYFTATEDTNENETLTSDSSSLSDKSDLGMTFEEFKDKYASEVLNSEIQTQNQDAYLKEVFDMADVNSDYLLSKSELAAAFFSSDKAQFEKISQNNDDNKEGEEPLGDDMMKMDMSQDFNPKG